MTLDEIYESFIWNESYTEEEYEEKIAPAISEGKKYKYLYPFIQPVVPGIGKASWEPCARIIASKTDDELKPYLYLLFEWLQDMNWPGAYIIYNRLAAMPFSVLEDEYNYSRSRAEKEHDSMWLMALDDFIKDASENPRTA